MKIPSRPPSAVARRLSTECDTVAAHLTTLADALVFVCGIRDTGNPEDAGFDDDYACVAEELSRRVRVVAKHLRRLRHALEKRERPPRTKAAAKAS